MNRAADSPYLLTGLLKCGICGANLIVVSGRGKLGNPAYGCPQNYMRGACSNSLKMRRDVLEKDLFTKLQEEVMESEIVEYTLVEFERQLKAKVGSINAGMDQRRTRARELEAERGRLVAGMAETGHSKFLVAAITGRERELAAINHEISGKADGSVDAQIKDLRTFVETRLSDIRRLMGLNVQRARAELSKHVSAIRLVPSGEGSEAGYVAEGEWDLLGGDNARTGLVAGVGFEPTTFGL
jgi:hypothetical protein